jgi:hypothetical protein
VNRSQETISSPPWSRGAYVGARIQRMPEGMTAADHRFFDRMSKAELFAVCKQLAALHAAEGFAASLASGSYLERVWIEWESLYESAVIHAKPPRFLKGGGR